MKEYILKPSIKYIIPFYSFIIFKENNKSPLTHKPSTIAFISYMVQFDINNLSTSS